MNDLFRHFLRTMGALGMVALVAAAPQARAEDIGMFDPHKAAATSNNPANAPDFKEKSWFGGWARCKDSAEQFARAQRFREEGSLSRARKAYNALVCNWGTAPEAPLAQIAIAQIYEEQGKFLEAFQEWQYYLEHYSAVAIIEGLSYESVVDEQFRVAGELRMRMEQGGVFAPSPRTVAALYHRITKNAPDGPHAAESVFLEGQCLEEDSDEKAVPVYERLVVKYPNSPLVVDALYRAAICRRNLSVDAPNDERTAIHALDAIEHALAVAPDYEDAAVCREYADALRVRVNAIAYGKAEFYDRIRKNPLAAAMAYREFLRLHPDAAEVPVVEARLAEIEKTNPVDAEEAAVEEGN